MTIYWERCDICGRHLPVRQCTMNPELMVCIHCCIACPLRKVCPKPAWELREAIRLRPKPVKKPIGKGEKAKFFEELLSKLDTGKKQ